VPLVEQELPTLPELLDRKIFEVMTSTSPKRTLGLVASLLVATLYQGNPDRNHKLWNITHTKKNL
jgi:hypothetical protein